MKKVVIACAALFLSVVSLQAQTVDEVIAKHIEARGGAEKLAAVKTVKQEASLSVGGMEISQKMTFVVGRAVKQEVSVMGQDIIGVIDGDKGWGVNPMGGVTTPTEVPADAVKDAAIQVDFTHGLLNYKEKGNTIELLGKEKVGDKETFKMKVTTKNGGTATHFIDTQSYQIVQSVTSVMGAEGIMKYSNFKAVDGIMFPFSGETENPMAGTVTITYTKIELNQPVDDAIFKMPK